MLERAGGRVAGVELVSGALVVAFAVGHRPDQGDVVHGGGGFFPAVGDPDSGHGRFDGFGAAAVGVVGLGVEGFELAGPALHPEQDAGHLAAAQLVGMHGQQVGEAEVQPQPRQRPGPGISGTPCA